MAGVTAQGATFTFNSFRGSVAGIAVEMPRAEVTNMTSVSNPSGLTVVVPTGEWSGGTIKVDFLTSNADPQTFVRQAGQLTFTSAGYSVSRRVVCESASVTAQAGDIIRGTLTFLMTDYTGN